MPDATEPIDKNELVYRRITVSSNYFKATRTPPLSASAFKPVSRDTDGISLTRKNYVSSPKDAAAGGFLGKDYYVIEMRAGDIESIGVTIKPDPKPGNIGHAIIPEIRIQDADTDRVLEAMNAARNLPFACHGPFPGTKPQPPQP